MDWHEKETSYKAEMSAHCFWSPTAIRFAAKSHVGTITFVRRILKKIKQEGRAGMSAQNRSTQYGERCAFSPLQDLYAAMGLSIIAPLERNARSLLRLATSRGSTSCPRRPPHAAVWNRNHNQGIGTVTQGNPLGERIHIEMGSNLILSKGANSVAPFVHKRRLYFHLFFSRLFPLYLRWSHSPPPAVKRIHRYTSLPNNTLE